MSKFEDDLNRGCLSTGEPLEALYGTGRWTQEPEPEPPVMQCYKCGGRAYKLAWDRIDCENCGEIILEFDDD